MSNTAGSTGMGAAAASATAGTSVSRRGAFHTVSVISPAPNCPNEARGVMVGVPLPSERPRPGFADHGDWSSSLTHISPAGAAGAGSGGGSGV